MLHLHQQRRNSRAVRFRHEDRVEYDRRTPSGIIAADEGEILFDGQPVTLGGPHEANDLVSLQSGARLYVNYCLGCHSAKYVRYNRLAADLQIDAAALGCGVERDVRLRTRPAGSFEAWAASLRAHFAQIVGTSPSAYRRCGGRMASLPMYGAHRTPNSPSTIRGRVVGPRHGDVAALADLPDVGELAHRVVRQLGLQPRRDGERAGVRQQQRVAVGRGPREFAGRAKPPG